MLGLLDVGRQHLRETRLVCLTGLWLVSIGSRWHYQDAINKAEEAMGPSEIQSQAQKWYGKCKVMLD